MIERLNKKGTLFLLRAIRKQAESDVKRYGTKSAKSLRGSSYIGKQTYESALNYLNEELPAIKEVLSESFKEL